MITAIITFIVGFALGAAVIYLLKSRQKEEARAIADELLRDSDVRRQQDIDRVIEHVKLSFGSLSSEALTKANDEFLKLRKSLMESDREVHVKELDSKKGLIDESLKSVKTELDKVQQLMVGLEKDRATKYGELDSSLKSHQAQVQSLLQTANSLREALASTKARGQWGERMAEDVLRLAGFIENVNYYKQKTMNEGRSRPDFSFPLPQGLMLNMDVKFPLDNYLRYLESGNETEESRYRSDFLRDVRNHVKAVCGRDYINPVEKTVDYVLLFIPNEQVYAFIHESDRALLDDAMRSKVIICSPLTLYAILAVIRQASDNFAFERASEQILLAVDSFDKQWKMFVDKMDTVGKRLEDSQKAFVDLTGTRRRQLDRVIDKIQDLRAQKGIELLDDTTDSEN
ncbi:MAG: DNA recombination protein RmuC [bacterium]|nr:DNA recombination protein RmuC [bacterium]